MVYHKLSNPEVLVVSAIALPVLIYLNSIDQSERGLIAALSVACIVSTCLILRDFAGRPIFWFSILMIALVHGFLVFGVPWKEYNGAAYFLAPLVIADMYVCSRLIVWLLGKP